MVFKLVYFNKIKLRTKDKQVLEQNNEIARIWFLFFKFNNKYPSIDDNKTKPIEE